MTDIERRIATETWPDADVALRAVDDPTDPMAGRRFRGYAAVFNSPSEKLGTYTERIKPGAFTRTLADGKARIRMFSNHNTDLPLASVRSGTLTLTEDARGLVAEAVLPDTTTGRDLAVLIREGIVDSMSFGFTDQTPQNQRFNESGTERTLTEVRLHEVSVVTGWPAYPKTSASVRDLAGIDADPDELAEAWAVLRDPDGRLTSAQRDLLMASINARSESPVIGGRLALWTATFATKAPH